MKQLSQKHYNVINQFAKVITKVIEIAHYVACGLMFLATVFALVAPQLLKYVIAFEGSECCGVSLSVYGFSLTASYVNQKIDTLTFVLFGIGATAIFFITALIFANLNKLFQNSQNDTPFKVENVKILNKVAIYSLIIPIISAIICTIAKLVISPESGDMMTSMGGFITAAIVFCLSGFFARGVQLENDVDGLV